MANVTFPTGRDRAQLILVSGLTIAVTLVVLILLLNTTIYTENVATRGIDSDVGAAADFEETVELEVSAIIHADYDRSPQEADAFVEDVGNAIDHFGTHQTETAMQRGAVVEVNASPIVPGIYLHQADDAELQDFSIDKVEDIRTATISVSGSSLEGEGQTDPIEIHVGDRSLTVNATEEEAIEIRDGEGFECNISDTDVDIELDFVNRTVTTDHETDHCEESFWANESLATTFELELKPGDAIPEGTYEIEVGGTEIEVGENDIWSEDGTIFVFEVETDLRYESASLVFETTRTIEGEPP